MRQAFTLIELMIVIAIIAIIAAIAIPNLLESRITANESAAAASLKSGFFAAQAQFQSGAYSDMDGDGRGEYATNHQYLAGATTSVAAPVVGNNNSTNVLTLLAPTYNVADGTAVGAYRYQIDTAQAAAGVGVDYSDDESFWGAYSAPNNPGSDGRRAFAINLGGVVYSTRQTATQANLTLALLSNVGTQATAMFAESPTSTNAAANSNYATPYQK